MLSTKNEPFKAVFTQHPLVPQDPKHAAPETRSPCRAIFLSDELCGILPGFPSMRHSRAFLPAEGRQDITLDINVAGHPGKSHSHRANVEI